MERILRENICDLLRFLSRIMRIQLVSGLDVLRPKKNLKIISAKAKLLDKYLIT